MIKELKDYIKESRLSFLISFIFLFASYGLMLVSTSFSIDSEHFINSIPYEWWNDLGRWGLTLVNKIFCLDKLVLFFNDYFTVIFLALFIVAFCFLLYLYIPKEYKKTYLKLQFIFPIVFLTNPIFAEQFNFSMQNVAVSLGLLLIPIMFISYYYVTKFDKYIKIVSFIGIVITTVIFGIYQSLIVYYIAVVIVLYLLRCINNGENNYKFLINETNSKIFRCRK